MHVNFIVFYTAKDAQHVYMLCQWLHVMLHKKTCRPP